MKGLFRRRQLWRFLLTLLILSWAAAAATGESAGFAYRDWNLRNLERIRALQPDPLTFAVLGDNRGNFPVFESLLRQMARDPSLKFAVHLGDMVDKGELEKYRPFFKSLKQYLQIPLLTVIGNHELAADPEGKLYTEIFGPRNYAFHLGSAYFIMFDDAAKSGPGEEQYRWLEAELQKGRGYKIRLVFLHTPLQDPRGGEHGHCLPPESSQKLAALFKKYQVSRVFAAHIHSFFEGRWDGVPYTITAGAGAKLYGADPQHFFYHYLKVTVDGDRVETQVQRLREGP
ncbi:MAG: metallophosphoesterase [Deltaproteobacteria bacterium]|nr:MAG: metallophosphoesterase [Deltaproteobacteria bacterium]